MAICIVCSIGSIPGELFVTESKETKIFWLCEFEFGIRNRGLLLGLVRRHREINDSSEIYKMNIFSSFSSDWILL